MKLNFSVNLLFFLRKEELSVGVWTSRRLPSLCLPFFLLISCWPWVCCRQKELMLGVLSFIKCICMAWYFSNKVAMWKHMWGNIHLYSVSLKGHWLRDFFVDFGFKKKRLSTVKTGSCHECIFNRSTLDIARVKEEKGTLLQASGSLLWDSGSLCGQVAQQAFSPVMLLLSTIAQKFPLLQLDLGLCGFSIS